MRKAVGIKFAVCKGVTRMLIEIFQATRRHLHDDSAVNSDFDVLTTHILTNGEAFVVLVVVAMELFK